MIAAFWSAACAALVFAVLKRTRLRFDSRERVVTVTTRRWMAPDERDVAALDSIEHAVEGRKNGFHTVDLVDRTERRRMRLTLRHDSARCARRATTL